jgi:hypothetical protein
MKPQLIFKKIDLAQTPPLMSALPPKADIDHDVREVRFVPKADIYTVRGLGLTIKSSAV